MIAAIWRNLLSTCSFVHPSMHYPVHLGDSQTTNCFSILHHLIDSNSGFRVKALDQNGQVIPHVYLGIQDYSGINYDYNDNLFIIEGVVPAGAGR